MTLTTFCCWLVATTLSSTDVENFQHNRGSTDFSFIIIAYNIRLSYIK